jgi:hypothetical protein
MKTIVAALLLTAAVAACGPKNKSPDTMPSNGSAMSGSDMSGSGSGSGSAMMMNGSAGATGAADPCGG